MNHAQTMMTLWQGNAFHITKPTMCGIHNWVVDPSQMAKDMKLCCLHYSLIATFLLHIITCTMCVSDAPKLPNFMMNLWHEKRCLNYWPFVRAIHWWAVHPTYRSPVMHNFYIFFVVSCKKQDSVQQNIQLPSIIHPVSATSCMLCIQS